MLPEVFTVLAIFALTLFAYYLSTYKSVKRPPGPYSFPVLGHLPLLGNQPARKLLEWTKIYGSIIYVRFGCFPTVVLNDATLIKAAFNLPAFSGRPHIKAFDDGSKGRKGFLLGDGPSSQEQRQFVKKNLKDFGYGSRSMESIVIDQVSQLLLKLDGVVAKSQPLPVKHFFNAYTINALWSIFCGKQLDPNKDETTELADKVSSAISFPRIIDKLMVFIPKLAIWFPKWSGYLDKMKYADDLQEFLERQLADIKATRTPNQPRFVLDAYLDKVEETSDRMLGFHAENKNTAFVMLDLFAAGVETTSTAMEWTLYYLAKFPQAQKKLQTEIDTVIGPSRLPCSTDRPQMTYAEAVTNEVLRIATILPLSLFHDALEDVEFNGYFIPKGTMVLGNLHAAHNNPKTWGDPDVFRPERFFDKKGKILKIGDFIPFSWGKRNCIGENLARLNLFLFTVSIYQRFEISAAGTLPSSMGDFGVTAAPFPFELTIKRRSEI